MRATHRRYSDGEDDLLRAHAPSMSSGDIAALLGRTEGSVRSRLSYLGTRRWKTRPFTPEEDDAIRVGFSGSSVAVALCIGRDPAVVRARAKRLGLGAWRRPPGDYMGYKIERIDRGDGTKVRRVPEHRAVMERYIGRPLDGSERVHHINGLKRDNRIDNLFLCSSDSAHSKAHRSIDTLLPELLAGGHVRFDRDAGVYRVCETRK